MIGRLILLGIILGYATLSAAIIWHLKIYAFSRSADFAIYAFATLACIFAVVAVVSYSAVDWNTIFSVYPYLFMQY